MFIPPLRIALSGGGIRGLAHIGALEVLEERGYLKTVREYLGTSSGSLCAFAICIGCTLSELRSISAELDFGLIRSMNPDDMFRFTETFGFDSGENLKKLLAALLRAKGLATTITFRELCTLRPTLPILRVFATDLNTCMPKEFSMALTPDASIVEALRASMCIPMYFTPIKDASGHLLVDGGVVTHFPFQVLNREEQSTTLGLAFSDDHKRIRTDILDLFSFLGQIYNAIYYRQMRVLDLSWAQNIVYLPCGEFPSVHFEASPGEKQALMATGRKGMETFLDNIPRRRPPRRFSSA